jgi:hypothetical protein
MRRYIPILAAGFLTGAVACGEAFVHSNPYDPAVAVTIVISGPDTLFSYGERGQFSAVSTPAFPDTAFQYASTDSFAFFPAGAGGFTSKSPPLYPETRTVQVSALLGQIDTTLDTQNLGCAAECIVPAIPTLTWRHSASKSVVLTQRVVRIQLRCPASHACDTLSTSGVWTVWADGFDALNQPILGLTGTNANPGVSAADPAVATFVLRDTTIGILTPVGVRVANITATRSGATWVVATRGSLADSLRLVVR